MPEISIVDIETRRRMEEGMLKKTGRDIRDDDAEYDALMRLCRIADVCPWCSTYLEVEAAIQSTFDKWCSRHMKSLGGGRP